jgi:hypothetical protein
MKTNLVIKIPVKIPADLINASSVLLAGGTIDYLRGVLDSGEASISFETVADDSSDSSTNADAHATTPAPKDNDYGNKQ